MVDILTHPFGCEAVGTVFIDSPNKWYTLQHNITIIVINITVNDYDAELNSLSAFT